MTATTRGRRTARACSASARLPRGSLAHPFRGSKSPLTTLQIGGAISGTHVPAGFPAVRARTVFGASFYDSDVWVRGAPAAHGAGSAVAAGPRVHAIRIHQIDRRAPRAERRGRRSVAARGARLVRQRNLRIHPQTQSLRSHRGGGAVRDVELRQQRCGERSTSARADAVLGNSDRVTTLGVNWHVNRWVKVQANLIREDIGRPSMGPLPERSSFWSRVFRLQLTL